MTPALEVRSPGAYTSIQDGGRRGLRRIGMPWAGVLDPAALCIANRLVGNPDTAPVLECFEGGQRLAAMDGPLRLAVAGAAQLTVESDGRRMRMAAWRSFVLQADETLRIERIDDGRVVVVAVEGLTIAPVLGSAATYARSRIGGLDGAPLAAGDRLPLAAVARARAELHLPAARLPEARAAAPIRVLPGPQDEHFDAATLARFFAAEWRISMHADRMGMRLEGPRLAHRPERGADIVSDATVPGAIQVPGNGQPIVLLADGQTAGGYPKIGVVITADLGRLATRAPGSALRFAAVDAEAAEAAAATAAATHEAQLAGIVPLPAASDIDLDALYRHNLVDGVIDALSPDSPPPGHS